MFADFRFGSLLRMPISFNCRQRKWLWWNLDSHVWDTE